MKQVLLIIALILVGLVEIEVANSQQKSVAQTVKRSRITQSDIFEVEVAVSNLTEQRATLEKMLQTWGLESSLEKAKKPVKTILIQLTAPQLAELKMNAIECKVIRNGKKVEMAKGSYTDSQSLQKPSNAEKIAGTTYCWNNCTTDVTIPDLGDWVYSEIPISCATSTAIVTTVDVYFSIHHSWGADLYVDLTDDLQDVTKRLWNRESGTNPYKYVYGITDFAGEPVNQTWLLWAQDVDQYIEGHIDEWSIKVWYENVPDPPSLSSPANNAVLSSSPVRLSWYSVFGATEYYVEVADNPSFDSPIYSTSTGSSTYYDAYVPPGSYYWHVKACNTTGWGSFSSYRYFVYLVPPEAPELNYPSGIWDEDLQPIEFGWYASAQATSYRLQVSIYSDFRTCIHDRTMMTLFDYVSGFISGYTYYWRVKASNAAGESPWSEVWDFDYDAYLVITSITPSSGRSGQKVGDPIITLTIDGDGFSNQGTITFSGEEDISQWAITYGEKRIVCQIPELASSGDITIERTCDGDDDSRAFTITYSYQAHWPTLSVPIRINENCSNVTNERELIINAMDGWNSSGTQFRFDDGGSCTTTTINSGDGYCDIFWAPISDLTVGARTYPSYNPTTRLMDECDIIMNSNLTWSQSSIQAAVLHELGHCASLNDLYGSSDFGKVMYWKNPYRFDLSPVEIDAMRYMYPFGCPTLTISGHIQYSNGDPIAGVVLNGLPGSPQTNSNGDYSANISCGFTGLVAPQKLDHTFDPVNKYFTNVVSSKVQDFIGTFQGGIGGEIVITSLTNPVTEGGAAHYGSTYYDNGDGSHVVSWTWKMKLYHTNGLYTLATYTTNSSNVWDLTVPEIPTQGYEWLRNPDGSIQAVVCVRVLDSDGYFHEDAKDICAIEVTNAGGQICDNTTWWGKVYVNEDVTVGNGYVAGCDPTLSIMPGTTVYLKSGKKIKISQYSRMIANATMENSIRFRKYDGNAWDRILIQGENCQFAWCVFDGGTDNVEIQSRNNTFTNCTFKHASKGIKSVYYGGGYLTFTLHNVLVDSNGTGIYVYGGCPSINQSTISNNTGVGIEVYSASIGRFTNTIVEKNGSYGIQAGGGSNFYVGNGWEFYTYPPEVGIPEDMYAGAGKNKIWNNCTGVQNIENRSEILVMDYGYLWLGERGSYSTFRDGFNTIMAVGKYITNNAMEGMSECRTEWQVPARKNRWVNMYMSQGKISGPVDTSEALTYNPSYNAGAGTTPTLRVVTPENPAQVMTASMSEKLSEQSVEGSQQQTIVDLKSMIMKVRSQLLDPQNSDNRGRLLGKLAVLGMSDLKDETNERSAILSIMAQYRERLLSRETDPIERLYSEAGLVNEVQLALRSGELSRVEELVGKYGSYVKNKDHKRSLLFAEMIASEHRGDYAKAWRAFQTAKAIRPNVERKKSYSEPSYGNLEMMLLEKAQAAGVTLSNIELTDMEQKPEKITLLENYPNPFNPTTTIKYEIPEAGQVTLKVYDMLGRVVATLEDGMKEAGNYTHTFDATKLSSGVYLSRLTMQPSKGSPVILVKKMLLVK